MRIPEELIPLAVLGVGGFVLVVITIVHGFGLDMVIRRYKNRAEGLRKRGWHPHLAVFVFAGAILGLLFVHIVEICIWGAILWRSGLVSDYHVAVYFSANTYTTLGMGSMVLPHAWHELCPIIAISGLFTFAWTTSELFNIVGYQRELVSHLSARRKERRSSAGNH